MHALDWIFLVVLGASLLIGAWRGLIFELFSLAGWVAAFLPPSGLQLTSVSACPLQGAKGRSVMPQDLRWYS